MDTELKYTLITGGSRGIGKALARECAGRGMNLLLVARVADRLEATAREIRDEFSISVNTFAVDLLEPDAPQQVWDWCKQKGYPVNILINNAGIGGKPEALEQSTPEHADARIFLNIRTLVQLTRVFLPELKSHSRSYILNMGSLSAYFPCAYKTVYSGSKAFISQFSQALNEELRGSPVSITVVNPNVVPTNSGLDKRIQAHPGFSIRLVVLSIEKVAMVSIDKMLKGKTVVVPGFINNILVLFSRIASRGFRERQTAKIFRRELGIE